ncbi:MAG: 3-dehydroquinate synthase, partial [Thermomicrobiaceae bacterium]|nr:3-dehydroquinate synthase [Thermomicrobiaceae bacterium]
YERADATVDAGLGEPDAVAEAILAAVAERVKAGLVPATSIPTPTGRSDIYVAHGLLARVGDLIRRRWPDAGRAWVISDDRVWEHWGEAALDAIGAAGLAASWRAVPAGEASKSLGTVGDLLDWLIGERIDRRDVVVALGGGVVGDLAGFVASIVLRGVGLVQVPTSLLAMVDSSVGGKTGVNHPLGKNLIGTFYQPPIVAVDPSLLETLPERELRAGWAEIVKHAMIERTATGSPETALLDRLEALPGDPLRLEPGDLAWIVERNIQLKAAVVRRDEREAGPRRLLNYGHTLGHAMEAAGYRYLHGEAVALGMRAAARIALRLSRCERDLVERQDALLDRLGLPARFDGDLSTVVERLSRDKKAVHGTLTWILPVGRGEVEIVRDVPLDVAVAVARDLGAR